MNEKYRAFAEKYFQIVDKQGKRVDFKLNRVQQRYLLFDMSCRDDILKARQEGLSTIIDSVLTQDFLTLPHSYNVIVADIEENATGLLDRVKIFLSSYEEKREVRIPLKYNSRFELYNEFMDSRFVIGTSKNVEFGRSKTITNLHLSELAFYANIEKMVAGAGQAVVDWGRIICETTANGFNDYKKFRTADNGFKKIFYRASDFYDSLFLAKKRKELGRLYDQEYPDKEAVAFLSTGDCFFDKDSLAKMYQDMENDIVRE